MSGASALAAARRRRANPQPTNNSNRQRVQQQVPKQQNQQQPQFNEEPFSTNNAKFNNPAQLLKHVYDKTERLERMFLSNDGMNDSNIKNDVKKLLSQNSIKLDTFEKSLKQNDRTITNVLSDFEDRINKMEQQIDKIKEISLKIQTFSMETNLALMMFKRELVQSGSISDISMNNLVESFKQEGVVEEELINNAFNNTSIEDIKLESEVIDTEQSNDSDSDVTIIPDVNEDSTELIIDNTQVNVIISEDDSDESTQVNNETDLNKTD